MSLVKLSEICQIKIGKTPSKGDSSYWNSEDIPWVSISDMKHKEVVSKTVRKISQKALTECFKGTLSPKGSIIMSFKLTIGRVSILGMDAVHNEAIITLIPNTKIDKDYLYHIISIVASSVEGTSAIMGKTLNSKILANLQIPLPPLEEQVRISNLLEKAEQQNRNIQSSSDSLLQDLSDFRKEILTRAFRGELTEQDIADGTGQELLTSIQLEREQQEAGTKRKKKTELPPVEAGEEPYGLPENWAWTRLGEVGLVVGGGTPKTEVTGYWSDKESGIPWTTPADFSKFNGIYFDNPARYISETGLRNSSATLIPVDSVLFTSRAPIGYVGIASSAIATNQGFKSIVLSESITSKYVFYYFKAFKESIKDKGTGTTFKEVSGTVVKNLEFPLPPLAEQHRIVEKIEAIFATLDTLEQAILLQKAEASTCYEEILRKSLEGK
jgi:type I restriction enzyme S subunit